MDNEDIDVMVVDDAIDAAESMAQLLEMSGYNVRVASNGVEALSLMETLVPDCVILDVVMPEMDGCELAEIARKRYGADMVLIAVTGMGDHSERVQKAISLSDHFLKKPVDFDMVLKLLQPAIKNGTRS